MLVMGVLGQSLWCRFIEHILRARPCAFTTEDMKMECGTLGRAETPAGRQKG